MSFADLTPEAYKAAERAARGLVEQYDELNLEYDEVYHEALIYLAERPELVAAEMNRSDPDASPTWRLQRRVYFILSRRLRGEKRKGKATTSYEEWHDWYTETVDGALVDG